MVWPINRPDAGQHRVFAVLMPKVINDTQGWRRVMAYIDPPGEA